MDADDQARFDALFDAQDQSSHPEDRRLLAGQLTPTGRLGSVVGHGSQNQIEHVQLDASDGQFAAYFKPANGLNERTLGLYEQTRASSTIAEAAAWRLAVALGSPYEELVAPCVVRFIDEFDLDAPGALSMGRPGETESDEPLRRIPGQCVDAAFFDALIAQQDRHEGNWLWDASEQRMYLFDHGCAFAWATLHHNRSKLSMRRRAAGAARLTHDEIAICERIRDSGDLLGLAAFLEPRRAAALLARATAMAAKPMTILRAGDFR